MKQKMVAFLVVLCLGLGVLAGKGFSGAAKKTSADGRRIRHISEDIYPLETMEAGAAPGKYSTAGFKDETECYALIPDPEVPVMTEHGLVGPTHYEFQQYGSMGRMISATSAGTGGHRHVSWMWTAGVYPGTQRRVYARSKSLAGWNTPYEVGLGAVYSGYCNQTHLHDGSSVVLFHRTGIGGNWSYLAMEGGPGQGLYGRKWDLPDDIPGADDQGAWPKGEVLYCTDGTVYSDPLNYIHIVETEGNTEGGEEKLIGYLRCYVDPTDVNNLKCQTPTTGGEVYNIPANAAFQDEVYGFDFSCDISAVVVTGRGVDSQKVAIAYMPLVVAGDCCYMHDVAYIECPDNGDGWIAGGPWPPTINRITNYAGDTERAYHDLSACYDYEDNLHIVWVTAGFYPPKPCYYEPGVARLYHWSEENGISLITSAIYEGADAGAHNLNIAKMSVSAKDPIYHPGGDSTYLYCVWTQFKNDDVAENGYANGDLYGSGSLDGGNTWGKVLNLTGTQTPDCAAGNCVSEHWPSLAQNMLDGDLHIEYVCDRDAGGAIMGEGAWEESYLMYMRLPEWEIEPVPHAGFKITDPDHWYRPPLKVEPNQTRIIKLKLQNSGNKVLWYMVLSDNPTCVDVFIAWTPLPAQTTVDIPVTLNPGACNDKFICGNVILETDDPILPEQKLLVHAVVADDYYECPRDPSTVATVDNGVLELRMNANCQMEIDDIGTFPDVHEVFFRGGTIVATTQGDDTLVGRFMCKNDWRAGAQDMLYTEQCDVSWEPDFWILYTKDIYIEATHLSPPYEHLRWWWWEISKQVKIFKADAPHAYKHLVIQYVRVKRKDPPTWWPDQTPFSGYEDTWIGVAMDIDCPSVVDDQNLAGYDFVNHIAGQVGFGVPSDHPEYRIYHAGLALADGGEPGESIVPYGSFNVRNDQYLYPQDGWGWVDRELFDLARASGHTIQDPASWLDRSYVLTARKIPAGADPNAEASFTIVMVIAPGGFTHLKDYVATARDIVATERAHGIPAKCGDVNGDFVVDMADVVYLIGYFWLNGPEPLCPINRGDVNSDGIINVGDIIYLLNFFKGGPEPNCPGIWY